MIISNLERENWERIITFYQQIVDNPRRGWEDMWYHSKFMIDIIREVLETDLVKAFTPISSMLVFGIKHRYDARIIWITLIEQNKYELSITDLYKWDVKFISKIVDKIDVVSTLITLAMDQNFFTSKG